MCSNDLCAILIFNRAGEFEMSCRQTSAGALHYITLHLNYTQTHNTYPHISQRNRYKAFHSKHVLLPLLPPSLPNWKLARQTKPGQPKPDQAARRTGRQTDPQTDKKGKRTCVVRCGRHVAGVFVMCGQSDDIETLRLYQKLLVFHIEHACTPRRSPCLS